MKTYHINTDGPFSCLVSAENTAGAIAAFIEAQSHPVRKVEGGAPDAYEWRRGKEWRPLRVRVDGGKAYVGHAHGGLYMPEAASEAG